MNSIRRKRQKGTLTMVFGLAIVVMVGFTGLAVDAGYLELQKRRVQIAADAAAMGALREMELGNTDLSSAGLSDASLNGFTNGQNSTTVTIANPPTSGNYTNDATAVQATVTRTVPTFFMRIFGPNSVTVSATAVGKTSPSYGSIGGCIFAMNPTASGAFTITGTVTITTACSAMVESNSSSAFSMVGTSTFDLANGAKVGVVGPGTAGQGWSLSGGASIMNVAKSPAVAEAPVNIQSFNDPLANAPVPSSSGLTVQTTGTVKPNQTVNLSPGIYCGGMDLKGTAILAAGTYIIAGGGITIDSQATVSGTGVTFYNTSGSKAMGCNSAIAAGGMTFNGGATINLSAPTGGTPCGVLFFEDRSVSGLSHKINGNSNSTFGGALYFLHSNLQFAGTNQTPGFLFIVADTITLNGTSNLQNDHSTLENVYTVAPASTGGGLVQ
jgi:Flp pilus assembly protein TadG